MSKISRTRSTLTGEDSIQSAIADYLDSHPARKHFQWFHVPNGGHLSPAMGRKRKRLGAKAGVPDIFIIWEGGRCLQVEVKTAKGKLTPTQASWRAKARKIGNPHRVVRSVEDFERVFREW